jgi:hypothetical protein
MSFGGGSSGGGQPTGSGTTTMEPYAPAQPALNQIISEAGTIYNQGPQYVAPNQQMTQGLAAQEVIAGQANTQISNTIQGQYSNPFLSPLIADAATSVYNNVSSQFSGAGRTPGSPMSQQQVTTGVANAAAPYAFQAYENERGRQLQTAQNVPGLTAVGEASRSLEQERLNAPMQSLQQYAGIVNPIGAGLPTTNTMNQQAKPNALSSAAGGAMTGAAMGSMFGSPGMGAMIGGGFGLLGGLL